MKIGCEFIDNNILEKLECSVKNCIGRSRLYRKPMAYRANMAIEYLMVYRKRMNKCCLTGTFIIMICIGEVGHCERTALR